MKYSVSSQVAGITVGHNTYVLREVVSDLVKGYFSDVHQHRFISASHAELDEASTALRLLVESINNASTSKTVTSE